MLFRYHPTTTALRLFLPAFVVLFTPILSTAQDDDVVVSRIERDPGALFFNVNQVTQDSIGFLWVGTESGAYRFDGRHFVDTRTLFGDTLSSGRPVRQVVVSPSGSLWLNADGVVRINPSTREVRQCFRKAGGRISVDRSGQIWYFLDSVYRFDESSSTFVSYPVAISSPGPSVEVMVQSALDPDLIWVLNQSSLARIHQRSGAVESYPFPQPGGAITVRGMTSTHDHLGSIFQDHRGMLWIGSEAHLYRFDQRSGTILQSYDITDCRSIVEGPGHILYAGGNNSVIPFDLRSGGEPARMKAVELEEFPRFMTLDHRNNLWIAGHGVQRFQPERNLLRFYRYEPGRPLSLSTNLVRNVFTDRSGAVWAGTEGGGLCKLEPRSRNFFVFSSALDSTTDHFNVRAIAEDSDHNIWIGSFNGLHVLRGGTDLRKFRVTWPVKLNPGETMLIGSLCADSGHILWVGDWGSSGLFAVNTESRKVISINSNALSGLRAGGIRAIMRHKDGSIWVATTGAGVFRLERSVVETFLRGGTPPGNSGILNFRHDPRDNHSITGDVSYCFSVDPSGAVWVGTSSGLNRYAGKGSTFTRYVNDRQDNGSLGNNEVRALLADSVGAVWVCTNGGGLNRLDVASGRFTRFGTSEGLSHMAVYGILRDGNGNIWTGTQNGLCRMDPATSHIRIYREVDGLQNNEFNTGAYLRGSNGQLYFGGVEGFNVFYPDSIYDNPYVPPVLIDAATVFDTPLSLDSGPIDLPYSQNSITFEFIGLNFLHQERNGYSFILEGFETKWHDNGNNTNASYFGLGPGAYTFLVRGSNNDGLWNPRPASFQFVIRPPWWQTWWFRTLSAFTLLSVAGAVYRNRMNALRREKEIQEQYSRQLLQNVEEERKRIAGEIHDSLGQNLLVVKNMLETGSADIEGIEISGTEGKTPPGEVFRGALDVIVGTLQDARTLSYNLHPLMLEELGLTRALHLLLRKSSESFGFAYEIETGDLDGVFSTEQELHLFRIVQESLNNIMKHANAANVIVSAERVGEELIVKVSDDGKGFNVREEDGKSAASTGFGRKNMRERAKMLGAVIAVTSSPGNGTTVSVRLPLPAGSPGSAPSNQSGKGR